MTFSSVVALIALREASQPPEAARSAAPIPSNSARRARSSPRLDVLKRFLAWRRRRATRVILSALDDRTLRDIGVERSQIDAFVRSMDIPKDAETRSDALQKRSAAEVIFLGGGPVGQLHACR